MAQVCDLTGKGKQYGHNVPFSQKKTQKVWKPNLQKKTFMFEGQKITLKLSTQAIRTLKKKGLLVPVPAENNSAKDVANKTQVAKEDEPVANKVTTKKPAVTATTA